MSEIIDDQGAVWVCILALGAVTYVLRAFPILFHRDDGRSVTSKPFFEYSSYALIGGIIATSAFGNRLHDILTANFASPAWMALLALTVTFLAGVRSRKPTFSLAIGIGIYALALNLG